VRPPPPSPSLNHPLPSLPLSSIPCARSPPTITPPSLGARFGAHGVNMSDVLTAERGAVLMTRGWVEVPEAVTVATTTTMLELLADKTNLSMRPIFNGQDLTARVRTHRGKRRHDDTRLLHIYNDDKTPRMTNMEHIAGWTAVRAVMDAVATAADTITGVHHHASDLTHIRSSGSCPVQPAHTDHPWPWLRNGAAPGFSAILALRETTVNFWGGSHEIFRRQASLDVVRSEAGEPVAVRIKGGTLLVFRHDVIHSGGASTVHNDRLFCNIFSEGENIGNETGLVTWK